MTEKQERPATLARRQPQPAPDETVDPVDTPTKKEARRAPARKKAAPQLPAPKGREVVFPLSTRVAGDVLEMLDRVTKTGVSQRAAVEHAIRHTYGHEGTKE